MSDEDKIYRDLQRHLDSLLFGYPATKSGVEIKILSEAITIRTTTDDTQLPGHSWRTRTLTLSWV